MSNFPEGGDRASKEPEPYGIHAWMFYGMRHIQSTNIISISNMTEKSNPQIYFLIMWNLLRQGPSDLSPRSKPRIHKPTQKNLL